MSTAIAATPVQRYDRSNAVNPNLEFESYLQQWCEYIKAEQMYNLSLVQAAVTLHVRARAITISDAVSNWGISSQFQNQFIIYDPNLDGDVHPINIVGPAIATNKSTCLQSHSQTEVTSANDSAQHKQIAKRWQRVADYLERTGWDESKRAFIFDAVQKDGNLLVEVCCREEGSQSVPMADSAKGGIIVFRCDGCGQSGISPIEDMEQLSQEDMPDDQMIPCPQCKMPARAEIKSLEGIEMKDADVPTYEVDDRIIPFFNFTVDTYGARIDGLQSAGWLQVQELRDQMYMQTHYPNVTFAGSARWSYPLQCAYALSRGRWDYFNQYPSASFGLGHEKYEERAIYLHESAYSGYRAPKDYQFVNANGEVTFSITAGQTIGEAQEELYGEDQHGFKFNWYDQQLLNIPTPEKEILNFRQRFSDIHWSRESGSYLSSPNYSVVFIQDDITQLNTELHNVAIRNSKNPVFYDSLVFDKADFSNDYIGTKNAALLPDGGIKGAVTALPVPTPNPYLSQQMQWLFSIKDSITQVTAPMRGEVVKDQTYAAQRQALDQSVGGLTPVLKSFAKCKNDTFRNKAAFIQKRWTVEQFQRIGSFFGEPWTDEDVAEMCQIDFDRDLIVSYVDGSEMPATPLTKEMKFLGALQQLASVPPEILMQVITPEKWGQIIERIGEMGEMGFDVSSTEVDEMISQKRFNDLIVACQPYADWTQEAVRQAQQEVVNMTPPTPEEAAQGSQGTPVTAFDLLTEQVLSEAGISFNKYEDIEQSITFFVEQLRSEIGRSKENFVLIEVMTALLGLMQNALDMQNEEKMANDPQVQAAMQAQQEQAAQDAQKLQLETAKLENDSRYKEQDIALRQEELDVKAQQADRDAVIDLMKYSDETD